MRETAGNSSVTPTRAHVSCRTPPPQHRCSPAPPSSVPGVGGMFPDNFVATQRIVVEARKWTYVTESLWRIPFSSAIALITPRRCRSQKRRRFFLSRVVTTCDYVPQWSSAPFASCLYPWPMPWCLPELSRTLGVVRRRRHHRVQPSVDARHSSRVWAETCRTRRSRDQVSRHLADRGDGKARVILGPREEMFRVPNTSSDGKRVRSR